MFGRKKLFSRNKNNSNNINNNKTNASVALQKQGTIKRIIIIGCFFIFVFYFLISEYKWIRDSLDINNPTSKKSSSSSSSSAVTSDTLLLSSNSDNNNDKDKLLQALLSQQKNIKHLSSGTMNNNHDNNKQAATTTKTNNKIIDTTKVLNELLLKQQKLNNAGTKQVSTTVTKKSNIDNDDNDIDDNNDIIPKKTKTRIYQYKNGTNNKNDNIGYTPKKSSSQFDIVEDIYDWTMDKEQEYLQKFHQVTQPYDNVPTIALRMGMFSSGFRNQIMAFTTFVMKIQVLYGNYTQILLPSIVHKDLYGTEKPVPHEFLFDVVHWNSHYPDLPRFVQYDPKIHYEWKSRGIWNIPKDNATSPYALGDGFLMLAYMRYSKGRGPFAKPNFRNLMELTMIRGAFRPRPSIQAIINHVRDREVGGVVVSDNKESPQKAAATTTKIVNTTYLALHARVEPDMQVHMTCRDIKEKVLGKVIEMIYIKFPIPKFQKVFIALNRKLLERDALNPQKYNNSIAEDNLRVLNDITTNGMWNGTIPVFEGGIGALENTIYNNFPAISGALTDFFMARDATYFIGTEISSFSTDIVAHRFYRGETTTNYKYVAEKGILDFVTKKRDKSHPPYFEC